MALWSSRFSSGITSDTLAYTETTEIDARMARHDLWGSLAHILMLCACGIVDDVRGRKIVAELLVLLADADSGMLVLDPKLEDVHLNVESRLIEQLTLDVGGRLHTARSRNDQVATDARLYVREALLELADLLAALIGTLLDRTQENAASLALGHTHSQAAQPITFGFWLAAHASAFARDLRRIRATLDTVNLCPLGACALAGTSFAINREMTARLLGFNGVLRNALDATSTRDFMIETVSTCAMTMAQISRLAEEIVVWNSFEMRTISVADGYTTGSSIMPQKKNPVVAEIARARAATVFGALTEILCVTKGVSMGYSSDLQQDKPPVWRALDVTRETVAIFEGQMRSMTFDSVRARQQCWESFSTATELANLLTGQGIPFREAYQIIGGLIAHLESRALTFRDADVAVEWLSGKGITLAPKAFTACVDPEQAVRRQTSLGGTAPAEVEAVIVALRSEVEAEMEGLHAISRQVTEAYAVTLSIAREFAEGALQSSAIKFRSIAASA